jgi:hypothetical protein
MDNPEKILGFLQKNKYRYCDDCISNLCDIHPRQQVNQICNLRIHEKIIKEKNICKNCDKEKITRKIL